MAKVSFSKLNLNKNTEVSTFEWGDQTIEVKDYLPIGDKLNLISEIINDSIDKNGYYNEWDSPDNPYQKLTFWQKIAKFFAKIALWFKNLFK